jgi:hypothetical protein
MSEGEGPGRSTPPGPFHAREPAILHHVVTLHEINMMVQRHRPEGWHILCGLADTYSEQIGVSSSERVRQKTFPGLVHAPVVASGGSGRLHNALAAANNLGVGVATETPE